MLNAKVLAVQIPAPCPMACDFCRTPDHNQGNISTVGQAVLKYLQANPSIEEVYLTSNGETGYADGFEDLVSQIISIGKSVTTLGATEKSVVAGTTRAEVSYNSFTSVRAKLAIEKAKKLGIPAVISIVDFGEGVNAEVLKEQLGADGFLVRALQQEGLSSFSAGKSSFSYDLEMGIFPNRAYRELSLIGAETVCINHLGEIVPFLGATS